MSQNLSNEELVKLYQETKDNNYLHDLIESNRGFIYYCRKYALNIVLKNKNNSVLGAYVFKNERDDLIQEGYIGIIKAAKQFNADHGAKFTTYASKYIIGSMLDFLNKEIQHKLNTTDIDYDFNSIEVDSYDVLLKYDIQNMITLSLNQLEQKVIKLHYGFYDDKEYSLEEINKLLNISNAKYIVQRSLKRLRTTQTAKEYKAEFFKEKLKNVEVQIKNPELTVIRKIFYEEVLENL